MPKKTPPRPTDAELTLLRALWKSGPGTVREIQQGLGDDAAVAAASVLKLLQIMTGKGLLERDASSRAHVYRARHSEQSTQAQLTNDLVDRAFSGSAARLALRALSERRCSPAELAEVQRLIDGFADEEGE